MAKRRAINEFQRILFKAYGEGDYAFALHDEQAAEFGIDLNDAERIEDWIVDNAGDTLFLFLFRELAEDGGVDKDEYVSRLYRAKGNIQEIINAIENEGKPERSTREKLELIQARIHALVDETKDMTEQLTEMFGGLVDVRH